MAYCYKDGKRINVTSDLLSKELYHGDYSPQTNPYSQNINERLLCPKDMVKCFLVIFVIMFIVFY